MAFCVGGHEKLNNGDSYSFIAKHRSGSKHASVWTISFKEELFAADDSITRGYLKKTNHAVVGYYFICSNGKLIVVGKNRLGSDLRLCKFVNSTPAIWHGYPADYCNNAQDKPSQITLVNMHSNGLIDKKTMSKVSQGKR